MIEELGGWLGCGPSLQERARQGDDMPHIPPLSLHLLRHGQVHEAQQQLPRLRGPQVCGGSKFAGPGAWVSVWRVAPSQVLDVDAAAVHCHAAGACRTAWPSVRAPPCSRLLALPQVALALESMQAWKYKLKPEHLATQLDMTDMRPDRELYDLV